MDAAVEEGQADQHQGGRIDDAENGGGDGDDLVQPQVGRRRAEQADGDHQPGVPQSAAGELREVGGSGADQGHGGGDTGQSHHNGEEDDAGVSHQVPHDGDHQEGPQHRQVEEPGSGDAQIGQAQIDHQQGCPGHKSGTGHHPGLGLGVRVALIPGAFQNDDAKNHGGQHIHGLIACLDAGDGDVVHRHPVRHRTDGGQHALHDQHQQADQQHGGQHLAHDVHNGGLLQAQQQDDREKEEGEKHRTETGHQRRQRHLIGGGCRPGDGQHRADAQNDGTHQQGGGAFADAAGHVLRTAAAEHGEKCRQGQTDVGQIVAGEAQEPLFSTAQAQIGRKDHITCAEKHGEQGKADDEHVRKGTLHKGCLRNLV